MQHKEDGLENIYVLLKEGDYNHHFLRARYKLLELVDEFNNKEDLLNYITKKRLLDSEDKYYYGKDLNFMRLDEDYLRDFNVDKSKIYYKYKDME